MGELYTLPAGSRERCNRSTLLEIKDTAREHSARELSTAGHSLYADKQATRVEA